jgi:hypothetical protein
MNRRICGFFLAAAKGLARPTFPEVTQGFPRLFKGIFEKK